MARATKKKTTATPETSADGYVPYKPDPVTQVKKRLAEAVAWARQQGWTLVDGGWVFTKNGQLKDGHFAGPFACLLLQLGWSFEQIEHRINADISDVIELRETAICDTLRSLDPNFHRDSILLFLIGFEDYQMPQAFEVYPEEITAYHKLGGTMRTELKPMPLEAPPPLK
jgi:hypothetical protein